jgi:hypothetical protein
MRYLVALLCALMLLVALPQRVAAQIGEEAATSAALAVRAKYHLLPQLMLRASYYLYLDAAAAADTEATSDQTGPNAEQPGEPTEPTRSRLERWHPEAFDDPSKPTSMPVYVDPVAGTPLAVPEDPQVPTAPPTEKRKRSPGAKAGIAVGVMLGAGLVGVAIGAAVFAATFEL